MRKPNVRFLSVFALIAVLVMTSGHFIHAFQLKRTSGILLLKARELRNDGNLADAIGYFNRYIELVPEDTTALAEYGQLLANVRGGGLKAQMLLEQVLRRDPQYPEIRRTLVEVSMNIGRYNDAIAHLQALLPEESREYSSKDASLFSLRGQCQEALRQFEDAARSYRMSVEQDPHSWETYSRLAAVLQRRLNRPEEATQAINALVEKNPDLPEAYYARAAHMFESGELEEALVDAERTIDLRDEHAPFHLLVASISQQLEDFEKAEVHAERALTLNSRDARAYLVYAELMLVKEDADGAVEMLRRGIAAIPNDVDLMSNLAGIYVGREEYDAASDLVEGLRQLPDGRLMAEFIDGRILLQKGETLAAIAKFEELRGRFADRPEMQQQMDFWLGMCYDRVDNLDQRIAAYRRAVDANPKWVPAQMGLAGALAAAGRIDEAVDAYQRVLSSPKVPEGSLLEICRLTILQQLLLPQDQRKFQRAEAAWALASQAMPDSPQVTILRAEIHVAQGQIELASNLLADAVFKNPDAVELRMARVALAARQGQYEEARALLRDARVTLGDRAEIRQEQIRQALNLDRNQDVEATLVELEQGWNAFSKDDQFLLTRQLAAAYTVLGDTKKAELLWSEATRIRREWLPGYLFQFEAAAAQKDSEKIAELVEHIRHLEGREKGPLWCFGEAARHLLMGTDAVGGDRSHLARARNLLSEALVQRPRWSQAHLLLGEIELQDGNLVAATDRYRQALELGNRSPQLIRTLVMLLYQREQFAEADQVLRRLETQQTPFSNDLNRLASEVSWRVQDFGRAENLARRAAEHSNRADDHLWLGQLDSLSLRYDEAEKSYRRAVELEPDQRRTWMALIQHWIRLNATDEINGTLLEASKHLSQEQADLTRAQTMDLLGRIEEADAEYRKVLALEPRDAQLLLHIAESFLRHQKLADAKQVLEQVLDSSIETTAEERIVARRDLAIVVAGRGSYTEIQEALTLIDQNEKEAGRINEQDLRVRAALMSALPGQERRRAAIRILEQVISQSPPTANDRYLLAQLYEADDRWQQARKQLQALVAQDASQTKYLVAYVQRLLAHKEWAEAEIWYKRLEAMQPDEPTTIELKAWIDVANGRADQVVSDIERRLEQKDFSPGPEWAASLYDRLAMTAKSLAAKPESSVQLSEAAESAYQREVKNSQQAIAAASFLARQGRTSEALDLCARWVEKGNSQEILIAAIEIANQPSVSQFDRTRVEEMVVADLAKRQQQPLLYAALATLYEKQLRFDEAMHAYRSALESDPEQIISMNNLALLLAYRGKPSEAMVLIEKAIELYGPHAALLDSRGTVRLALDDPTSALNDFLKAVADQPSPARWFHVALAQLQAQATSEAQQSFKRATDLGLKPDSLHPLELSDFERLNTRFKS